MILRNYQQRRANNFYLQLRNLIETKPRQLDEYGIIRCSKCDGTGLSISSNLDTSNISWDGQNYCDECNGIGFNGLKKLKTFDGKKYICGVCSGVGCIDCSQSGFSDWISHAMGR